MLSLVLVVLNECQNYQFFLLLEVFGPRLPSMVSKSYDILLFFLHIHKEEKLNSHAPFHFFHKCIPNLKLNISIGDFFKIQIPAALIPFCAYQTGMTMMGQKVENLSFPACTIFLPTLHNGQVCYRLNLSLLQTLKTQSGPDTGLFLVLDPSSSMIQEDNEFDQAKKAFNIRLSPKGSFIKEHSILRYAILSGTTNEQILLR